MTDFISSAEAVPLSIDASSRPTMRYAYDKLCKIHNEQGIKAFTALQAVQYYPFTEGHAPPIYQRESRFSSMKVCIIENEPMIIAKHIYTTTGSSPCILNCANAYNVGGGFDYCRGSQEEYLFRNSTLIASLWPHRRGDDERCPELTHIFPRSSSDQSWSYPLTECGGIFSPHVMITGYSDKPIAEINDFIPVSVISAAAIDLRPKAAAYSKYKSFHYEVSKMKLRTILHIAEEQKQRHLILTSLGCGAFHNPPKEIARAFNELLQEEFVNCFEEVIFAIIYSKHGTIEAFKEVFPVEVLEGQSISSSGSSGTITGMVTSLLKNFV